MKIAIDLRDYTCGIKRGIYFYAYGLYQSLMKYDQKNQYLGIENYPLKSLRDKNPVFRQIWDLGVLPLYLLSQKIDILHFTSPNETDFGFTKLKLLKNFKTIATIHDIIPFVFPKELLDPLPQNIRSTFESQFQMALKVDHLIAISQATKDDLVKTFNIDPGKISVVYQCNHDDRFQKRNPSEFEFIYQKYKLPKDFILNPSGKNFHKNFDNIAIAYHNLPVALKEKYSLVIQAFLPNQELQKRQQLCQKLSIAEKVIFLNAQEEDVPYLYNAASLTLAVPFYEGFGLSPLESFCSGTPVIAGNTSSQPEVCENAALLVNPYDPNEIRQALEKILEDQKLREVLIQKGYEQAKKFNHQRRAKETIEVYKNISR